MVVLVLIVYYLKAFDPKLDPFRKEGTQKLSKYPNSVDYFVNNLLQKVPGLGNDSSNPVPCRSLRLGGIFNNVRLDSHQPFRTYIGSGHIYRSAS